MDSAHARTEGGGQRGKQRPTASRCLLDPTAPMPSLWALCSAQVAWATLQMQSSRTLRSLPTCASAPPTPQRTAVAVAVWDSELNGGGEAALSLAVKRERGKWEEGDTGRAGGLRLGQAAAVRGGRLPYSWQGAEKGSRPEE